MTDDNEESTAGKSVSYPAKSARVAEGATKIHFTPGQLATIRNARRKNRRRWWQR